MTEPDSQAVARDAAARARAQTDFTTPLVVEAGAGSGKTSILVARIVAWSLGPGWERAERWVREQHGEVAPDRVAQRTLSRVVAITFTEAAAAEMAGRVGAWLGAIAAGRVPREIERAALPDEAARRARADALRSALDRLVVRTIHAWCRRLLAERPLEAGLHPAFEVDADEERTGQLVREVLEHSIPEAYRDRAAPLARLAVQGHGPSQIERALAIWALAGVPAARLAEDPLSPERVARFVERLRDACDRFVEIEQGRLAALRGATRVQATAESIQDMRDLLAAEAAEVGDLLARLDGIWEKASVDRLNDWAKGRFGVKDGAALGGDADALAAVCRLLHARLAHALSLDPARLDLARRALAPLAAEVERRMRAAGIESFAALLRDARALVSGDAETARNVRRGIDQLLVDEFQDTDAVQCAIVGCLALEGAGEERPGLFLVGDPRQSIYGWRSADLRAYDAFVARVEAAGGTRLFLSRNFRSLPAVLDEVRRCIEPVMVEESGVQPPFQVLQPHRAEFEEAAGEVEHWISWRWDTAVGEPVQPRAREAVALEASALACDVARLAREQGVAWRDVAVLFRGMTDVDAYLDALREAGVPYTVERDRRYYQRREVIEASALLRTVLDPHDHVALVAWLRSASVGVPDAAWIPLWTRGFPDAMSALQPRGEAERGELLEVVRRCVREAAARVDPTVPGLERITGWDLALAQAVGDLAELRQLLHEAPADVFIERLRMATLVEVTEAARYLGPYRVANLDQFFRDVREDLEQTGGDLPEVLRRIRQAVERHAEVEEARPREAADDAVRVMSIHKAKGLDFRHVYLAQLHKGHGGGPGADARPGRGDQESEYELFGAATLGFDEAAEQGARTEAAERVRTLYVAMTRACDRLVLMGIHPLGRRGLAGSHAELIASRRERGETPAERMAALARMGSAGVRDPEEVLWRFPGLAPEAPAPAAGSSLERPLPDAAGVARGVAQLAERRVQAEARQRRPRSQAASGLSHEATRERLHAERFPIEGEPPAAASLRGRDDAGEGEDRRDAQLAAAVGTAVHAALERWPLDVPREAGAAVARSTAQAALVGLLPEPELEPARRAALAVLDRFLEGPLFERFMALADAIVARELPVLLAPRASDAAVGHVVGSVDLLYRDAASGELVVADYKSDDVRTPEQTAERVQRYGAQGAAYVRAVHEALALDRPPRFELWFLASGECVDVPAASDP
jgi:ATP-dependent helicase/nuclease subunit A